MINAKELKAWLAKVDDEHSVGVDEGGLTLVVLDQFNLRTGAYMEVGGEGLDHKPDFTDVEAMFDSGKYDHITDRAFDQVMNRAKR